MADSDKKRRSGRARNASSDEPKTKSKKKASAPSPSEGSADSKLHSPWGPLLWMLIPLIACVAYGVATR